MDNPSVRVLRQPGAATGAHHHGDQKTILYVVEGTAWYRWGDHLEYLVKALGDRLGDRTRPPPTLHHQDTEHLQLAGKQRFPLAATSIGCRRRRSGCRTNEDSPDVSDCERTAHPLSRISV